MKIKYAGHVTDHTVMLSEINSVTLFYLSSTLFITQWVCSLRKQTGSKTKVIFRFEEAYLKIICTLVLFSLFLNDLLRLLSGWLACQYCGALSNCSYVLSMFLNLSHSVHHPQRLMSVASPVCSRKRSRASERAGCQRPRLWRRAC